MSMLNILVMFLVAHVRQLDTRAARNKIVPVSSPSGKFQGPIDEDKQACRCMSQREVQVLGHGGLMWYRLRGAE